MSRFNILLLIVALFGIISFSFGSSDAAPAGKKVLAILDNPRIRSTHSIFFNHLTERGFTVDFVGTEDRSAKLRKYGEWLYDHLVVFAPSASDVVGIKSDDVLEFIDSGRNMILATDSNIGDFSKEIASECNIEFDEESTHVIDHLNYDVADYHGQHTLIAADAITDAPAIFKAITSPILFRGVAQDIEEDSDLLFPLLSGYASSYSHSASDAVKDLHVSGTKISLVTALQARNNARVIFSGSLELFGDKFFKSHVEKHSEDGKSKKFDKSGNEEFVKQVTSWAFQERGVLRASNAQTHLVGETVAPFAYTIKQDVEYSIDIEEWNGEKWVPYTANDVQLEYIMLDPYVRTTLKHDGNGRFHTRFILPDVYGVFTFKVEYNRKGVSNINSIIRIPVRPFRHNEYERFIESAYPYYASAFSMMAGLFVFSWFFLYNKEK